MKKKVWGWSLRDEDQKRIRRSEKKLIKVHFFEFSFYFFLKAFILLFFRFFKKVKYILEQH